jgi:hypothetical protein
VGTSQGLSILLFPSAASQATPFFVLKEVELKFFSVTCQYVAGTSNLVLIPT